VIQAEELLERAVAALNHAEETAKLLTVPEVGATIQTRTLVWAGIAEAAARIGQLSRGIQGEDMSEPDAAFPPDDPRVLAWLSGDEWALVRAVREYATGRTPLSRAQIEGEEYQSPWRLEVLDDLGDGTVRLQIVWS